MSSPEQSQSFPYEPILEVAGADFHLRLANPQDAPDLAAANRKGGEELARFVPQARQITTVEAATQLLQVVGDQMEMSNSMRYHQIPGQPGSERPLFGSVSLRNHTPGEHSALVGVWTLPEYRGQGRITRAAETVFDYAARKDVWDLRTVYAKIAPDNQPSERLFARLGFQVLSTEPFEDTEGLRVTGVSQMVRLWSKQL